MTRLEEELRAALRRQGPPAGFAERVIANAQDRDLQRKSVWANWLRAPALRWAAACVVVVAAATGGGLWQREQRRRAEGERAKAQVMLALRITSSKLRIADRAVRNLNRSAQESIDQEKQ